MYAKVKSVYFNHPSQGNSTNYYIILDPRDKAAPHTSQQIRQFTQKRIKYPRHILFFFFLIHSRALFALNQSQAKFAELDKYSQIMLSEAFLTPNIASSQFNEYPELGSRSKSSPKYEPTMFAELFFRFDEYPEQGSRSKCSPN